MFTQTWSSHECDLLRFSELHLGHLVHAVLPKQICERSPQLHPTQQNDATANSVVRTMQRATKRNLSHTRQSTQDLPACGKALLAILDFFILANIQCFYLPFHAPEKAIAIVAFYILGEVYLHVLQGGRYSDLISSFFSVSRSKITDMTK